MRSLGIVLVVLGAIALIYTGFTYTTKETIIEAGPIEINREREKTIGWPPIVGGIMIVGGIALLLTNKK